MLPASIEGRLGSLRGGEDGGGEHFVQWWRVAQNWAETLRITGAQQRAGLPSYIYHIYIPLEAVNHFEGRAIGPTAPTGLLADRFQLTI